MYIYPRFFLIDTTDSGFGFRLEGVRMFLDHIFINPVLVVLGVGYFSDVSYFSDEIVWNDIGLAFFSLLIFGFLGWLTVIWLFFLKRKKNGVYEFVFIFGLFISKISPSIIFFLLFLLVIFFNSPIEKKR